jgi:Flp pilus assembly protein TadB
MAAARKIAALPGQPAPRRARRAAPKAAAADAAPMDSPALALQADLSARWEMDGEYAGPRWSPRRTLALAGGVSLVLWLVIGLAIRAVVTG